jgi:integrase
MATLDRLKGSIYQRGAIWWVKFYQHGRPMRESSKSSDRQVAERLLLKRNAALEQGQTVNLKVNRATIDELLAMVVTNYRVNGKRSLTDVEARIKNHLRPFFGGYRAVAITADRVMAFVELRQRAGAANGEINRELAILRRGYTLGRKAKKIDDAPAFDLLEERNTRKDFFEREQFEAVVSHLKPELAGAFRFAYVTGWRIHSEVLSLQWRQVDLRAGTVRLDADETKNREARVFKFKPGGELDTVLRAQEAYTHATQRDRQMVCTWVFHRGGEPIKNFYRAWRMACFKAGLGSKDDAGHITAARIAHDLRRTAVRNLVRAGVPERVAMTMTGHKTRSVFERYNITSDGDLDRAAEQLESRLATERAHLSGGHNLGTIAPLSAHRGSVASAK